MGSKDIILKPYLADNNRFADLVNASVFQGRQVILPSQVVEQDSVRAANMKSYRSKKEIQRTSDTIKKIALGTQFVVVSLENQNDIHYAMPIRNFVSEATDYQKQYDSIKNQHEQKQDLRGSECLSGFSKKDRIIPVITIVLYFGEEKWDGATDLYELMDMQYYPLEIQQCFKNFVNNYHINLLDVRHMENTDVFRTDLKQVFNFIKRDANKKELQEYLAEHRLEYESLTSETFDVIEKLSNFDFGGFRRESVETGGNYSMCRAMEEMLEDAREEGRQEMCKAMEEMLEDAREKVRQEMSKAMEEMLEDAREEGRKEVRKEIEELIEYAKSNGFEHLADKIARKLENLQPVEA
ncbi:MAG: Rpn family recombination-promoting nuclease/putative transposase [Lachnospiraceae bacterium]|nr:Rpn family recombination-promoting nuclease/putative transposase [Lachnospiraceae bacterium]